jgi:cyanate permease
VLLAVFVLTAVTWLLAAFVPFFQGFHHLANLGLRFSLYLLAIAILLQGFRRLFKTRSRSPRV